MVMYFIASHEIRHQKYTFSSIYLSNSVLFCIEMLFVHASRTLYLTLMTWNTWKANSNAYNTTVMNFSSNKDK